MVFQLTALEPKFKLLGLSASIVIPTLDPITESLRDRIVAAGSSINSTSLAAIDDYVKGCKSDGIWNQQLDVGAFVGNSLSGGLVKLKTVPGVRDTLENFNYVEGDYSEATGIKGDGNSKYLNSGFRLITHGGEGIATSNGLAIYLREVGNNSVQIGSANFIVAQSFHNRTYYSNDSGGMVNTFADSQSVGLDSFSQLIPNNSKYYRNGSLVYTETRNFSVSDNSEIYLAALNRSGSSFNSNRAISFYCIKRGLNEAQELAFYQRVITLQQALGRAV